jgi:hypothetical protein
MNFTTAFWGAIIISNVYQASDKRPQAVFWLAMAIVTLIMDIVII